MKASMAVPVDGFRMWPLLNVVETGRTPQYPYILPRAYGEGRDDVFQAVIDVIGRLPRWRVVRADSETAVIRAEARTRLFRFVDDVTILLEPAGSATIVRVRSASRVGKGDFGQNARNIERLFSELDRQMSPQTDHG